MRNGELWTDAELRVSVETYLFLLRIEHAGYQLSENELAGLLAGGPLGRRRQSSIRYRMRNISAILADRGLPILKAYSPAPRAGAVVRARLEAMLFSAHDADPALDRLALSQGSTAPSPADALAQAESALRRALSALEQANLASPRIGHNKPPEAISDLTYEELREAIALVAACRSDLASKQHRPGALTRAAHYLVRFGVRAAAWAGEQLSEATKAGLETAARVAAIAMLASLPPVARAVEALLKLL